MSDTTLNRFLAQGTSAERLAFVPNPPVPASGPDPGYFFFETDTNYMWAWDDTTSLWVQVTSGAGITNPMTTSQDIIVATTAGAPARLGVGSHAQVLTVGSGGLIDWETPSAGFANPMTTSQDLIVGGISGAPARLAVGSVGRVLTVGSGGIIDWESIAVPGGAITASPYTMATAKVLGRATAGTGAIEELAETGTGSVVLATSPTLVTPALGTPSALNLANATNLAGSALTGAYTASGLTMATARLLGRTTASTGAAEEITVGAGLTLNAGSLTAAAAGADYLALQVFF